MRPENSYSFSDIGVMQITYGGDDEEDRLKAELRTETPNVNSEGASRMSMSNRPGLTPGREELLGKC